MSGEKMLSLCLNKELKSGVEGEKSAPGGKGNLEGRRPLEGRGIWREGEPGGKGNLEGRGPLVGRPPLEGRRPLEGGGPWREGGPW